MQTIKFPRSPLPDVAGFTQLLPADHRDFRRANGNPVPTGRNGRSSRSTDTRLLDIACAHVPTLPFDPLDLLIVDEIGKNITGSGMDLNMRAIM